MRSLYFSVFSIALAVLLTGCGDNLEGPYRAEVLTLAPASAGKALSDPTQYEIKEVTFTHLEDLETLGSKYFSVISGGTFTKTPNAFYYSLYATKDPKLTYSLKNNVVIPQDNYTLYALSTAYQFDYILSKLEEVSGVSPDELTRAKGKFTVFFDGTWKDTTVVPEGELATANAAYADYYFFTITAHPDQVVPFSANLKIMAHEMGHLFFEYLTTRFSKHANTNVLDGDDHLIRGLNEGFADIFSFTITGISDIFGAAVGDEDFVQSKKIQRDFSKIDFDLRTIKTCQQGFYCLGTLFANSYFKTMVSLGMDPTQQEMRSRAFKDLANALSLTGDAMREKPIERVSQFMLIWVSKIKDVPFRNLFLKNINAAFAK